MIFIDKIYFTLKIIGLLVLAFGVVVKAQSGHSLYFSNQFQADPARMPETSSFALDDPVYVVLNVSGSKHTLADFVSIDPTTGKRNFWLCFSPDLSYRNETIKPKCVGILPEPVTDAALAVKAAAYKILPGGSEISTAETELSESILPLIDMHSEVEGVAIPFEYYIYGKAEGPLRAGQVYFPMKGWKNSHWKSYNDAFLAKVNAERQKEKQKGEAVAGVRTKAIVTDWVKTLRSKRTDAVLERDIMKWWRGPDPSKIADPVVHVYFLDPNYEIIRNEFGIVIRKSIPALILWKERNADKCHTQWRSFGYQSMGGATFSNEMEAWNLADNGYPRYYQLTEGREVRTGAWYDVECSPFVK